MWLINYFWAANNHDKVLLGLMAVYTIEFFLALQSKQPGKAVYWLGAFILSIGILMQKG